jgi:hypothetical protein
MKYLYLIERLDQPNCGELISAVVCAKSLEEALSMKILTFGTYWKAENLIGRYLGKADSRLNMDVVHGKFESDWYELLNTT